MFVKRYRLDARKQDCTLEVDAVFSVLYYSVYEKLFKTSDILSDLCMIYGGHSYNFWWTFTIFIMCFSVFRSDIKSDVLRENVGHGVPNVGHVRMSDDFSYTLMLYIYNVYFIYTYIYM